MFKHNICGDQPEVPDGMPDSASALPLRFFASPRYPPFRASFAVTSVEVHHGDVVEEPERNSIIRDLNGTS